MTDDHLTNASERIHRADKVVVPDRAREECWQEVRRPSVDRHTGR
jgi:hypothetical protein